jgi:hypothetical protein
LGAELTGGAWAAGLALLGAELMEADMADNPASGQYSDELGGPDSNEQGTDLLGGQEPTTDELGGPEPDEQRTDLLGGAGPG